MSYIKILDHPNLVRDTETKAVLNINLSAKEAFLKNREQKREMEKKLEKIDHLENKIKKLDEKLNIILDRLCSK